MDTLESRQAWKEHVYGKCYACGEGYSKDDWRFQASMFEDENEGVQHLDMVCLFLKNNRSIEEDVDGNGLCCSCTQDTLDDCEPCAECEELMDLDDLTDVLVGEGSDGCIHVCGKRMEGSDYLNVCHECGTNHHYEYGTTKTDGRSYFDFCHDCYQGETKKQIDKQFSDE
jgi:hypothetical protein